MFVGKSNDPGRSESSRLLELVKAAGYSNPCDYLHSLLYFGSSVVPYTLMHSLGGDG